MENQPQTGYKPWLMQAFALGAFAIALPLFGFLSGEPDFFVAHKLETIDVLLLFLLVFSLPLLVMLLLCTLYKPDTPCRPLCAGWLAVLFGMAILPVLNPISGSAFIALLLAAGFYMFYQRSGFIRQFLLFSAPFVLLLPVYFLGFTPLKRLISVDNDLFINYPEIESNTPLVMLLFDELPLSSLLTPSLEIDQNLFPNFYGFSKKSTWFANATTVADHTTRAVPAILTGQYPDYKKTAKLKDYPVNLFTLLGGRYEMHIVEPRTQLCPNRFCDPSDAIFSRWTALLPDLWVVYQHVILPKPILEKMGVPSVATRWSGFSDKKTVLKEHIVARFLTEVEGPPRPVFYFLHVELPHSPWVYLPSGHYYDHHNEDDPEGLVSDGKVWVRQDWPVIQAYQRHLMQLMFTDRMLGVFLDRLHKTGLYNDAMVIVLADHGINFVPGEFSRGLNQDNIDAIAPVPLFIKMPHQKMPEKRVDPVSTVDVLPTVIDTLDLPAQHNLSGQSLFDKNRKKTSRKIYHSDKAVFPVPEDIAGFLKEVTVKKYRFFENRHGGVWPMNPPGQRNLLNIDLATVQKTDNNMEVIFDTDQDALPRSLPIWITGTVSSYKLLTADTFPVYLLKSSTVLSVSQAWQKSVEKDEGKFRFSFLLPEEYFPDNMPDGMLLDPENSGNPRKMLYVALPAGS